MSAHTPARFRKRPVVIEAVQWTGVNAAEWRWFGNAGHFIGGRNCRFHLATQVGPWWVSTVGEYLPDSVIREVFAKSRGITLTGIGDAREQSWMDQQGYEDIGFGRKFETMVFRAGEPCQEEECGRCGMPLPDEWGELDADGYNSAGDATRGHYAMCEKWAAVPATATDDCEAVVSEKNPATRGHTP